MEPGSLSGADKNSTFNFFTEDPKTTSAYNSTLKKWPTIDGHFFCCLNGWGEHHA